MIINKRPVADPVVFISPYMSPVKPYDTLWSTQNAPVAIVDKKHLKIFIITFVFGLMPPGHKVLDPPLETSITFDMEFRIE